MPSLIMKQVGRKWKCVGCDIVEDVLFEVSREDVPGGWALATSPVTGRQVELCSDCASVWDVYTQAYQAYNIEYGNYYGAYEEAVEDFRNRWLADNKKPEPPDIERFKKPF